MADHESDGPKPYGDPSVPPPKADLPPAPVFPPEAGNPPKYRRGRRKKTRSSSGGKSRERSVKSEIHPLEVLEIVFTILFAIIEIAGSD